MSAELGTPDFLSFWQEVAGTLPGKGVLPDPRGPGVIKAKAADVHASLARDGQDGLAPFDPPLRWRVLSHPFDSVRLGCGRLGVPRGYVVESALLVLAAEATREPPRRTREPSGLVEVGPVDRTVVLEQAKAAYSAAMATRRSGGGLGLPVEAAP